MPSSSSRKKLSLNTHSLSNYASRSKSLSSMISSGVEGAVDGSGTSIFLFHGPRKAHYNSKFTINQASKYQSYSERE